MLRKGARPQRHRYPFAEGLTDSWGSLRGPDGLAPWRDDVVRPTGAEVGAAPAETGSDTAELTELAAGLRLAVGRLNRRIRIDGHESIPPLQLSALVTVELHGPLRLSELARREAVTAPTMSRVLAALDEQGLVHRAPRTRRTPAGC